MNANRRRFIEGIGRTLGAGALAAISARLLFCRRDASHALAGGTCPPCPWSDLCPARSDGTRSPLPDTKGRISHG